MMQKLSDSTVRQISSGQVISDIPCVVKELVENALDSGASRIDISLQNFGLDKIEVTDDGCGINSEDAPNLALRHFTSKLAEFDDLQSVITYGFRGEGLASICAVADLSVVTRQVSDSVARAYLFNTAGKIITTSFVAAKPGTSVQVTRLFSNFPVRRNQFRGLRRLQDTLVAIEKLALSFALAHPKVQLGLTHGMERVFSKPCCEDRTEAVRLVLGRQRAASLVQLLMSRDEFEVELFLPRPDASEDKRLFAATPRLSFVFVNNRPVEMGEFHKLFRNLSRDVYSQQNRYPTSVLYISLPTNKTDFNLEPNKTRVVFQEMAALLEWLPQEIMLKLASAKKDDADAPSSAGPTEPDPLAWSMGRCLPKQPTEPTKAAENPHNKDHRAIESLLTPTEQFSSPNIQNGEGLGELSEPSKTASVESPVPPFKSSELQDQKYLDEISGSSKATSAENPAPPFKSSEMPTRDGLAELSESSKTEPGQKLMECPQPPILDRELLVTDAFEYPRESSKTKTSIPSNLALPQTELDVIFAAGPKQSPKQNSKIPNESPQSRTDRKRRISSSPSDRKEKRLRAEDIFKNRETEDVAFNLGELRLRLEGVTERSIAERSVIGVLHQLDACVIREGSELLLGNTRRILEMQEERRLQKDCQLPSVRLSSAVDVKKISCLSPDDLAQLSHVPTHEVSDRSGSSCFVLSAPELLRNGFRLQRAQGSFQVTRVPAPFEHDFGPVLGEVLTHLHSSSSSSSDFRPTSVMRHFLNEARRASRCQPIDRFSARDLELRHVGPLLSDMAIKASRAICGHNKPAFGHLWQL